MSRITRKEWYARVNAAWPATVPPLTAEEAGRAARKLFRFATGETWRGAVKVTSGNRYSWERWGVLTVNPGAGWKQLIHLLSHAFYQHYVAAKGDRPHGAGHARLERRMIREVV